MAIRDQIRALIPGFLLKGFRFYKKQKRNRELHAMATAGKSLQKSDLVIQLKDMGICPNDALMVHCRMSSIGHLAQGAQTLLEALQEAVGPSGHLLMPSSPVAELQYQYALKQPLFDVRQTPSAMGALSELFRQQPNTLRSWHPTEPVCASGPLANWLITGHFKALTPYNAQSPYARLYELDGKILYIGLTLINAGTHLHTLEDAVDFPYPVYHSEIFTFKIKDPHGHVHEVKTRVHNPEWSVKRRCDELIPGYEQGGVLKRIQLGQANCLLLQAKPFFEKMQSDFEKSGITMYHPYGI